MSLKQSSHSTLPLSLHDLQNMKSQGEKIACLTAYDASFATVLDRAGIDVILVGDTLGMIIQGRSTTVPVTIENMVYHSQCVSRGLERAFLVSDLPFMSYATISLALQNAAQLMQLGGANMVKLEGAHCEVIHQLTVQGVAVCAHLGLLPQSINQLGGYRVQGRQADAGEKIVQEAIAVEQAGASMLVLECVPAKLAERISARLSIPVIGIGAGPHCDGQVLVLYDILNITHGRKPKFFENFMARASSIEEAIRLYRDAVKTGQYPTARHSYA